MMQTIQCKLFSYNINNYNGTYFLLHQKNTKVLLVKGDTRAKQQEELNYYENQTGYLIRIHHTPLPILKQKNRHKIKLAQICQMTQGHGQSTDVCSYLQKTQYISPTLQVNLTHKDQIYHCLISFSSSTGKLT